MVSLQLKPTNMHRLNHISALISIFWFIDLCIALQILLKYALKI